jgi:N-dimethylarginine dimethylaminohydrolase
MDHADGAGGRQDFFAQSDSQARTNQLQEVGSATRPVKSEPLSSFSSGVRLGQINVPVLLMNLPLSLSAQIPNNAFMEAMSPSEREICLDRAIAQFHALYQHIAKRAIVYLLPSTPGLQDQTYVANLGLVLSHCKEDIVIISRFRSAPRIGEAKIGADFFKLMNFTVERPPETFEAEQLYFEGEADLKHIRGNLYIGAHGMRTSRNALTWAADRFNMDIVPFHMTDPYLYHLDGAFLRITEEAVLLCTSVADQACIRALEQHCEIIDISLEHARAGITSCLLLGGEILCDSDIELGKKSHSYSTEKTKIERLEQIGSRFGRTLRIFCMSEFYKSGAQLRCMMMHMGKVTDDTTPLRESRGRDRSLDGAKDTLTRDQPRQRQTK